jgi:hypothetical protein
MRNNFVFNFIIAVRFIVIIVKPCYRFWPRSPSSLNQSCNKGLGPQPPVHLQLYSLRTRVGITCFPLQRLIQRTGYTFSCNEHASHLVVEQIESNANCLYLKNWPVKRICGRCFICLKPPPLLWPHMTLRRLIQVQLTPSVTNECGSPPVVEQIESNASCCYLKKIDQ